MNPTEVLLRGHEITRRWGGLVALDRVSLTLERGTVHGVIGTNGAGKSTFPRLQERLTNLGAQLSGGEQQMLSIGRALMTHPELIVLDEATEGLAPLIVADIWRVIGEIRASGIATLIVDRDYRRVLARADRALVLQKGQVVLQGSAAEVASDPALAAYLGV